MGPKLLRRILVPARQIACNLIPSITTTRLIKLMHYQPTINYYKYSYFLRTVPGRNTLPPNIVSEASYIGQNQNITA